MGEKQTFDSYHSKRVTFYIVTKNRAEYLDRALKQCQNFVGPQDELIVVDGASTDHTKEVVKKYGKLVDVFISEPDLCGQHAQSKAMLLARGRYLKPLMDDDIYHSEATKQAIAVMERHPEIDLLLCGGTKERGGITTEYCVPSGVNYGKSTEDVFRYKGVAQVGNFLRRSLLAKLGTFFLTSPNSDTWFVLECIRRGAVVKFCRINSFHHIIYPHSMVIVNQRGHLKDTYRLVKEYCSPWFYFKYRLRNLDRDYPGLAVPWRVLKGVWDGARSFLGGERSVQSQGAVWDGGFS